MVKEILIFTMVCLVSMTLSENPDVDAKCLDELKLNKWPSATSKSSRWGLKKATARSTEINLAEDLALLQLGKCLGHLRDHRLQKDQVSQRAASLINMLPFIKSPMELQEALEEFHLVNFCNFKGNENAKEEVIPAAKRMQQHRYRPAAERMQRQRGHKEKERKIPLDFQHLQKRPVGNSMIPMKAR